MRSRRLHGQSGGAATPTGSRRRQCFQSALRVNKLGCPCSMGRGALPLTRRSTSSRCGMQAHRVRPVRGNPNPKGGNLHWQTWQRRAAYSPIASLTGADAAAVGSSHLSSGGTLFSLVCLMSIHRIRRRPMGRLSLVTCHGRPFPLPPRSQPRILCGSGRSSRNSDGDV